MSFEEQFAANIEIVQGELLRLEDRTISRKQLMLDYGGDSRIWGLLSEWRGAQEGVVTFAVFQITGRDQEYAMPAEFAPACKPRQAVALLMRKPN